LPREAANHPLRDAPEVQPPRWSREVGARWRGMSRRAGSPRSTPRDVLVQKVLERMMIDQKRRIAF
jgi:hypothetical protein